MLPAATTAKYQCSKHEHDRPLVALPACVRPAAFADSVPVPKRRRCRRHRRRRALPDHHLRRRTSQPALRPSPTPAARTQRPRTPSALCAACPRRDRTPSCTLRARSLPCGQLHCEPCLPNLHPHIPPNMCVRQPPSPLPPSPPPPPRIAPCGRTPRPLLTPSLFQPSRPPIAPREACPAPSLSPALPAPPQPLNRSRQRPHSWDRPQISEPLEVGSGPVLGTVRKSRNLIMPSLSLLGIARRSATPRCYAHGCTVSGWATGRWQWICGCGKVRAWH